MTTYTSAMSYAAALCRFLARRGIEAVDVLEGTGLVPSQLDDPEARIALAPYQRLVRNAMDLTGDRSLGLQLGRELLVPAHGQLGYAASTTGSVDDALDLALRYFCTRTNLVVLSRHDDAERCVIGFDPAVDLGDLLPYVIELVLSSFDAMAPFFIGVPSPVPGAWFEVSYPTPDHLDVYERYGLGDTRFGMPCNRLVLPRYYLHRTPVMGGSFSARSAEVSIAREYELLAAEQDVDFAHRVRGEIATCLADNPGSESIAAHLGVSTRTLKRRLHANGTTFQALIDEVRADVATTALRQGGTTVEQLASRLGYSDAASLTRAFKKWTGTTPGLYRLEAADGRRGHPA